MRIFSGPIRSPSRPRRGALIRAATPGTEAIIPLINAILPMSPLRSRTYSVRIGAIDPVATWIIRVVTNRLSTSFGLFREEKTSLALSISFFVRRKQINRTLAVRKKTGRRPHRSARKPPASGPSRAPLTAPVESVPSAHPLFWRGIWVAIRALAFGTNPPNNPSSARSSKNCQIFCASPISTMTIAMPSAERSSMILRPLRSASPPQNGEATAEKRKVMLKTSPDHILRAAWPVTPSCST